MLNHKNLQKNLGRTGGAANSKIVGTSSWTNSNLHHISYRFGVVAAYCSNFGYFAFLSHPVRARDNVRCHLWLIGKRVVDFLLVLI